MSCYEVFVSYSRKFSNIKTCSDLTKDMMKFQAVCISNQLIIFGQVCGKYQTKVFTYNDETKEWKLIECGILKTKYGFSFVKYHL